MWIFSKNLQKNTSPNKNNIYYLTVCPWNCKFSFRMSIIKIAPSKTMSLLSFLLLKNRSIKMKQSRSTPSTFRTNFSWIYVQFLWIWRMSKINEIVFWFQNLSSFGKDSVWIFVSFFGHCALSAFRNWIIEFLSRIGNSFFGFYQR